MRNSIKIKLINDCSNRLQFVKNIKDFCGLGLKDVKDIVDKICQKPYTPFEFEIPTGTTTKQFCDLLSNLSFSGDSFSNFEINGGDIQWHREIKMLQLGVGERQEYLDFVKQHIQTDFGNSDEMLTFLLNKLTQQELQEIINKIKY